MPSDVVVELMRGVEDVVVFMGVAFRGLPMGRSQCDYLSRGIVYGAEAPITDTAFMGLTSCC